jgi:periplasmic divalent cation tolerance protein
MAEETLLVLTNFPDADTARKIGRTLVEEKLAACVNLVPQVESIYQWKGAVETASEVLALIKTVIGKYQALESRLRELHPYEVPEIISFRIDSGLLDYVRWVEQTLYE